MPPEISQTNLPDNLVYRFEIGARDRVFQTTASTANKLAGVYVNCYQGLGLIDYQITA